MAEPDPPSPETSAAGPHPSDDFEAHRPDLTQLAYRMLGSVQDAEDAVQEAFLRFHDARPEAVRNVRAWLVRVTSNLCIDRLRKLANGPSYPGEWLPEPWIGSTTDQLVRDDTLSTALLLTIRRLNATERAVFLLREVFDYGFADIAAMLDLAPDNCRQLARRARRHIADAPPRQPDHDRERALGAAFFRAIKLGDIDELRGLLREDVVMRSDGGGKVAAVHYPLLGCEAVVRFFDRLYVRTGLVDGVEIREQRFNDGPGFVVLQDGRVDSAMQFEQHEGRIRSIWIQRNPDKLRAIAALVASPD